MKEGDLTTEQQAEMIAEASGWRRRALVAEAALKVSRAETEKAAQFAIAATPPMRDREAIARKLYSYSPHIHSGATEAMPPGTLVMATWEQCHPIVRDGYLERADEIIEFVIGSLSPPCDCLGEWVALTAERVLYVDKGKETILCDRLPSPITLVLKNPAHADGAYLPSADTGEFRIPLADRKGVSAAPCCLGVVEALEALMFEVRANREPLCGPVHKALMRADAALQGHRGDESNG
jgi:hypothetical protein